MLSLKKSLDILKKTDALLEGHFVLSSGLHSSKYIQCAKLLSFPILADKICKSLANKIKNADNKFEEYSLKLRKTFIEYTEEGLQLTEAAKDFIDDVDFSIEGNVETDQEYYKELIAKYFYLKL